MDPLPYVLPLLAILALLVVAHQFRERLEPVIAAVVAGLAKHASQHSLAYALAFLYAAAASLQALAEVATEHGWVYVAAFAKVAQPAAVAIIAFVRPSPTQEAAK